MAVMSKMERMLADRKKDEADPVLDEYGTQTSFRRFSSQFVIVMCLLLFFFIIALFLPLKTQVMDWARMGFVVTAILSVVALIMDRSTHLRQQ